MALRFGGVCERGSPFPDRQKQDVFVEGLQGCIHGRSGNGLPLSQTPQPTTPLHPHRTTTTSATRPNPAPTHCDISVSPVQARFTYAATSNPTNNRSPRVVTIGSSKPFRATVGERISQIVITTSMTAMQAKKIATGGVHAIHA